MKILVIENENTHYSTLSSLQEHEVIIANSIELALELLINSTHGFDMVLIDMLLPDIATANEKTLYGPLLAFMAMKNNIKYVAIAVPVRDEKGIMSSTYSYIVDHMFESNNTKILFTDVFFKNWKSIYEELIKE